MIHFTRNYQYIFILALIVFANSGCKKETNKEEVVFIQTDPTIIGLWIAELDSSFKIEFTKNQWRPNSQFLWQDYFLQSDSVIKFGDILVTYDSIANENILVPVWKYASYHLDLDTFWWNYRISGCEKRYNRKH